VELARRGVGSGACFFGQCFSALTTSSWESSSVVRGVGWKWVLGEHACVFARLMHCFNVRIGSWIKHGWPSLWFCADLELCEWKRSSCNNNNISLYLILNSYQPL
jgi:hypothetical protein